MTTVSWQTWVEINLQAAERLGVQDDDVVRVILAGKVEAIVYVYPGIREDVVAMPVGHDQYGRYAQGARQQPGGVAGRCHRRRDGRAEVGHDAGADYPHGAASFPGPAGGPGGDGVFEWRGALGARDG
jgi:hypothetical protein